MGWTMVHPFVLRAELEHRREAVAGRRAFGDDALVEHHVEHSGEFAADCLGAGVAEVSSGGMTDTSQFAADCLHDALLRTIGHLLADDLGAFGSIMPTGTIGSLSLVIE